MFGIAGVTSKDGALDAFTHTKTEVEPIGLLWQGRDIGLALFRETRSIDFRRNVMSAWIRRSKRRGPASGAGGADGVAAPTDGPGKLGKPLVAALGRSVCEDLAHLAGKFIKIDRLSAGRRQSHSESSSHPEVHFFVRLEHDPEKWKPVFR